MLGYSPTKSGFRVRVGPYLNTLPSLKGAMWGYKREWTRIWKLLGDLGFRLYVDMKPPKWRIAWKGKWAIKWELG